MITKRSLEKFKSLYEKHFNTTLSDEEAAETANKLLAIYRAIYGQFEYKNSDKNISATEGRSH